MSRNAEILASVSAASPNIRANYQELLGYWCQAEAVFIETLQPEPSAAIAKYRQKLAAGEVAVGHNGGTDALSNLALRARLATLEAEAAAARQQAVKAEGRLVDMENRKVLLHEALLIAMNALEWCYDVCDYPADGTSRQAKALDNAKGAIAKEVDFQMADEAPTPSPLEGKAAAEPEAEQSVPEYGDFIRLATADEPVWVPDRATWDSLSDEGKRKMMQVADLKPRELKEVPRA